MAMKVMLLIFTLKLIFLCGITAGYGYGDYGDYDHFGGNGGFGMYCDQIIAINL